MRVTIRPKIINVIAKAPKLIVSAIAPNITIRTAASFLRKVYETITGAIVSFVSLHIVPLKELRVDFAPVQNLNGYDSPWVGGGGKNKLKVRNGTSSVGGGTVTFSDDGTISFDSVSATTNVAVPVSGSGDTNKLFLPAGEYIISCEEYGNTASYVGVNVNSTSGAYTATSRGDGRFTIAEGDYIYPRLRIGSGATLDGVTIHPMIRLASDPDDTWKPYENICPISGWTGANIWDEATYDPTAQPKLSISWQTEAGTVYGGYVVVNDDGSCDVTADRVIVDFDGVSTGKKMTTIGSYGTAVNKVAYAPFVDGYNFGNDSQPSAAVAEAKGAKCSHLPYAVLTPTTAFTDTPYSYFFRNNPTGTFQIRLYNENLSTVAEYNTWLADLATQGNPLQVVYPLATPIVTHLPSIQPIIPLIGANNMWADCWDVTVTYQSN